VAGCRIAGAQWQQSATWKPTHWPPAGYVVTTTLTDRGGIVDCIRHEIHALVVDSPPHSISTEATVTFTSMARFGAQMASTIARQILSPRRSAVLRRFWADDAAYDPELVERELKNIAALGFNAISIGIKDSGYGSAIS